jgi:hypothetical protein
MCRNKMGWWNDSYHQPVKQDRTMRYLINVVGVVIIFNMLALTADASVNTSNAVTPDSEADLPRGKSTRFGLFRQRSSGRQVKEPQASTGAVIRGSTLEFRGADTSRIPLRKGVRFGYRYWLKLPDGGKRPTLTRVLIHPEMTLPDGTVVTRSSRMITRRATHGIVTAIDGYGITEDYELVKGDWVFQIWYGGHKLVEQTFTTYKPEKF